MTAKYAIHVQVYARNVKAQETSIALNAKLPTFYLSHRRLVLLPVLHCIMLVSKSVNVFVSIEIQSHCLYQDVMEDAQDVVELLTKIAMFAMMEDPKIHQENAFAKTGITTTPNNSSASGVTNFAMSALQQKPILVRNVWRIHIL